MYVELVCGLEFKIKAMAIEIILCIISLQIASNSIKWDNLVRKQIYIKGTWK